MDKHPRPRNFAEMQMDRERGPRLDDVDHGPPPQSVVPMRRDPRRDIMHRVTPLLPAGTILQWRKHVSREDDEGWTVHVPGLASLFLEDRARLLKFAFDYAQVSQLRLIQDQLDMLSDAVRKMLSGLGVTKKGEDSVECPRCGRRVQPNMLDSHVTEQKRDNGGLPSLWKVCREKEEGRRSLFQSGYVDAL